MTQTQAPATMQGYGHPEKPWDTGYCIEAYDILSALEIKQTDGEFSKCNISWPLIGLLNRWFAKRDILLASA